MRLTEAEARRYKLGRIRRRARSGVGVVEPRTTPPLRLLELEVAIPPSLNHAYNTQKGHRVLSEEGRAYKQQVVEQVALAYPDAWMGGRLALTLRLTFRTRQRRDLSNCIKLLEDALSEALHFNDCTIDRILVERSGYDPDDPRCEVRLEQLP
jgi:Holliday junction resolvase RusA-like endonuclease